MLGLTDKVLAIAGGAGTLVLGAALVLTVITKNSDIRHLENEIHNPKTGYIVRLSRAETDLGRCRSNRITMEDAVRQQNFHIDLAKEEGERRVQAVSRQLQDARRAQASAERRAAAILEARPGEDVCASADTLIMETVQ